MTYSYTPYTPDTEEAVRVNEHWKQECDRLLEDRATEAADHDLIGAAMISNDEREILFQALIAAVFQVEGWEGVCQQTLVAVGESTLDEIADALNAVNDDVIVSQEEFEQLMNQAIADGVQLTDEQMAAVTALFTDMPDVIDEVEDALDV